jgi:hypothetical protein
MEYKKSETRGHVMEFSTRQELIKQAFRVVARTMLDDNYCLKTRAHPNDAFPEFASVYAEAGITLGCKGDMNGPWQIALGEGSMANVIATMTGGRITLSEGYTEAQFAELMLKAAKDLGLEQDIRALEPDRAAANDDGIHGHVFSLPDLSNG